MAKPAGKCDAVIGGVRIRISWGFAVGRYPESEGNPFDADRAREHRPCRPPEVTADRPHRNGQAKWKKKAPRRNDASSVATRSGVWRRLRAVPRN